MTPSNREAALLQKLQNNKFFWPISLAVIGALVVGILVARNKSGTAPAKPTPQQQADDIPAFEPVSETVVANAQGLQEPPNFVLELFDPSQNQLQQQHNQTEARRNIEQIISTSYVLAACGKLASDDQRSSMLASVTYAQQAGMASDPKEALAKVIGISKASRALYEAIYSKTDCKDPKLNEIAKQLIAWQNHYLNQQR